MLLLVIRHANRAAVSLGRFPHATAHQGTSPPGLRRHRYMRRDIQVFGIFQFPQNGTVVTGSVDRQRLNIITMRRFLHTDLLRQVRLTKRFLPQAVRLGVCRRFQIVDPDQHLSRLGCPCRQTVLGFQRFGRFVQQIHVWHVLLRPSAEQRVRQPAAVCRASEPPGPSSRGRRCWRSHGWHPSDAGDLSPRRALQPPEPSDRRLGENRRLPNVRGKRTRRPAWGHCSSATGLIMHHLRDWRGWQSSGTANASTRRYRSTASGSVPIDPDQDGSNSVRIRSVRQPIHLCSFPAGTTAASDERPPCHPKSRRHRDASGESGETTISSGPNTFKRWVVLFRYAPHGIDVLRFAGGSQDYLSWKLGGGAGSSVRNVNFLNWTGR
jgi:hypothetical protein